ncbi:hypothetical protein COO60DRAFT_607628 [Scenedesmus sp. NREL 46B-D3]|nr:hypothetical protein COO60DRAFT_607628 [Scenedesmus sp. NREL 46B-D3]
MSWRLISETAKQKWGMSMEKNFKVTSNTRNKAMFREATVFAGHLQIVEKELTQWQRSIDSSFTNIRNIMLSPLPRVYEEGHNGLAVPSEPEPTMVGGDVQVEQLVTAAQETRKRLDVEVIQPIKQWMVAYRTIAERMRRLEALRLELDSRRRTVADLQGRCERVRANLGTTRARGEVDMEITLRKMLQHKEDKMQRTASQFQEMEQTVYNSLFTLIKDTSVLRDYAAAALLIVNECFSAGYASFNLEQVQYSTTAGAAAYPEANKYDPRMSEQLPSKPNTASGKAGRLGTGTPRSAAGFPDGDTGLAGKDFDQHGQGGGGYEAYDTRVSHQDMVEGYPGARSNYWATAAAH